LGGVAVGQVVQQRQEVTGRPVSLAARPALLAGRKELLADLDARLASKPGAGPQVVALYGLGGVGKTSAAVEYAYRHLPEVGLAWQFAATDPELLLAEFARVAAQLGAREVLDARDPVASVHAVLAAFAAEWLLVFDDVPGPTAVQRFLPPAGKGRVLITSQSAEWPAGWAVEVPVLGTEVAAGFLENRTGDRDKRAAEDLAAELGGLPLALEQAGAYIQASGTTLAGYLSVFRDRRADLLARGEAAGHPADVAATLGLALSRLSNEAPAAAGLLRLLACLAPEPVPLFLLLSYAQFAGELPPAVAATVGPVLGDPVASGDAVAALRRYSLVTPAGDGAVLVHRLVRHVTLAQVPAEVVGQWQQSAAALVDAVLSADWDEPTDWPVYAVLLPHARAVLDLTSIGMLEIAMYLLSSGSYPEARDLLQQIADAHGEDDAYLREHPYALAARSALADLTFQEGDAVGAHNMYAALLPIMERVRGPEHWETLTIRAKLAYSLGQAGDAVEARDQAAALLPVAERVMDPEDIAVLTIRLILANATGNAGDAAGARDQLAVLVPEFERALGPEDTETLATRRDLASWTLVAGDAGGARDQYAALVPIQERVLGPEHPDTLLTRANLYRSLGDLGQKARASVRLEKLLPIMERVLGPEHRDVLSIRHYLAFLDARSGDPRKARDQCATLLPIMERVLGPEHPQTLLTRGFLAEFTGQTRDAAGARDQYTVLLPIMERVLGPEHPETLNVRNSLAGWVGTAGDGVGARDQSAALLPIMERVSGAEHPDTLMARANLAYWTGKAGDAAGARDQYAVLLPMFERVLGRRHRETRGVRRALPYWTRRARRGR
jgi:tetratricopeptide (TPR) repeat protein